jgi:hypothetical protein
MNSFRIFIGIFLFVVPFLSATGCTIIKDEAPSPTSGNTDIHYIPLQYLGDASQYWNTAWSGHELYDEIINTATSYFQTNEYVLGEADCNDMTVDVWHKLLEKGIISLIVVGNLEKSYETFLECNHTWLMVYNDKGAAAAADLSRGKVYVWENVSANFQLRQYWEGFVYENPADLRADFKERW